MRCQVETYAGFRLHERPRRFTWGEAWLEVSQVMDRWVTPEHLCFTVRVEDRLFLLQYHQAEDTWEAGATRSGALPRG